MQKKLIVVLGMHRSGTSALTKSLELLGIHHGNNLCPAAIDNPRGFWEDRECLAINEAVLQHCDSAYDRLHMSTENIPDDAVIRQLQLRATQYISAQLESHGTWGFKDPRTCRLLGFWKSVFEKLDCEIGFIIAVRNPASVAASLAHRNKIPLQRSYFLWLEHTLPSLCLTAGYPRVVVEYDNFLKAPYAQLARIANTLSLPLVDRNDKLAASFEKEFLSEGLRHHEFNEEDLTPHNGAIPMVRESYVLLHELAADKRSLESAEVKKAFEDFRVSLATYGPAFVLINHYEAQLHPLAKELRRIKSSTAWKIRNAALSLKDRLRSRLPFCLRPARYRSEGTSRNKPRG